MKNQKIIFSRPLFSYCLTLLMATIYITFFTALAHSADVTLQWNSVEEADGYKVYYGTASETYSSPDDVGDQTSHTLSLDPGTYYFAVTAYNNYGESGYSDEVGPTTITANGSPTSVSLTSDLAGPQPEGMEMTFTAEANGGSGSYEYKFWFRNPDEQWAIVQDYSSSPNYDWNTTGFAGTSYMQVWARNAGSTDAYQVWDSFCCVVSADTNPPTSVYISSNLPNPQPEGALVTFTAEVTGGSGSYEYKFYLCDPDGQWAMVQDYSTSPNYTWNTTGFSGTSYLQVWVRNAGATDAYQIWNSTQFSTDMNRPTSVLLSSNLPNPQPEGTLVTFTAEVTGGSGSYEYKYYLCNPDGQWAMVQDYSTSPNYIWNSTGFVGTSYLQVWVRNAGSSDRYQVFDSIGYEIE